MHFLYFCIQKTINNNLIFKKQREMHRRFENIYENKEY